MSFIREQRVQCTRKNYFCDACGREVLRGSEAVRWAGMVEGDFQSCVYHPDCREAEVEFNREHGLGGCDWASIRYDRESADDEWVLRNYPKVADRLGIVAIP